MAPCLELSRRELLAGALGAGALLRLSATAAEPAAPVKETYETQAKGIRMLPGQWRPHYPWEHIAWVSPSWPSQDYLWLDFPEAIFTSQGLIFLSHINPPIDTVYDSLPAVPWQKLEHGIGFERTLPSGIKFGGEVTSQQPTRVDLKLWIENGSAEPLNKITLQTCAFLRGIHEFADYTTDNKFVHVKDKGWTVVTEAKELDENGGPYRLGWRQSGKLLCDLPVMVTMSNMAERGVAMTWLDSTLSMVSNPNHPCMHADPQFGNLPAGQRQEIQGRLVFFEGPLAGFDVTSALQT